MVMDEARKNLSNVLDKAYENEKERRNSGIYQQPGQANKRKSTHAPQSAKRTRL